MFMEIPRRLATIAALCSMPLAFGVFQAYVIGSPGHITASRKIAPLKFLGAMSPTAHMERSALAPAQSPWEVRENGWAPIEHSGPAVEGDHRKGPDGLEGWTLNYTLPKFRYPIDQWPLTLVIARNGAVIGRIQGDPFVWKWRFLANGREIAYEAGPPHGSLGCNLVETSTGHRLGTYDCFHTPLPDDAPKWVHELEDAP